jgi:monovalent cation:proton antiporter-2 (CPA2) family protein
MRIATHARAHACSLSFLFFSFLRLPLAGALISGSAGKPYALRHPVLRALRKRLGPVGLAILLSLSLCLVVEMPYARRLWRGSLPPVSSAVASCARRGRRGLEQLRAALPLPAKDAKKNANSHGDAKGHAAAAGAAGAHGADAHAAGGHDDGHAGMMDVITLLATSVLAVPIVSKLPGGSPVLGFLVGGAVVGPSALGLIANVEAVKHIAEIGVVFLLFNIGLELSLERLQAMAKYVFGLGTAQMVATTIAAGAVTMLATGLSAPASLVVGVGLAFSSTAVALQVLGDRGEAASRHGRAAFSVLLLQDLAVVLVFMLVPLLAPSGADGAIKSSVLLAALGTAIVKTGVAIIVIMAAGRVVLRPVYRRIADLGNTEIFAATTLLVALGTSTLTAALGLSAALGAFLAGLLLAETEYHLQVESDIAPYRGLLLGLFFMTVGMTIDPALLVAQFVPIAGCIALLVAGKVAIMCLVGPMFGLSFLNAARSGMYLGPGGEFAFVTFGLAQACGLLTLSLCNTLTLVVALSMAVTPSLAGLGAQLRDRLEAGSSDMAALQPAEGEVDDMRGHVIIAGFGRSGQLIATLLSEQLIPFVALDMRSDRVTAGRESELPVFFGDAGSPAVLHSVGAARAACAVVCMDTAGANYRTVYSMGKHYPAVPVYVRAIDVADGLKLEKAGATACVPETLEPSLQLAAAVLAQLELPPEDVVTAIDSFRRRNISELREMASASGTSLGYGASTAALKAAPAAAVPAAAVAALAAAAAVVGELPPPADAAAVLGG